MFVFSLSTRRCHTVHPSTFVAHDNAIMDFLFFGTVIEFEFRDLDFLTHIARAVTN